MSTPSTSSADFFENKYRQAPDFDPWRFATSEYELSRYRVVMQALEGRIYKHAYEPGCSIGVLTQQLASVCKTVDACDFSATAVDVARERCRDLPGVTVRCASLTGSQPWSKFDLIVLCEIGYYFTADAWQKLVENMVHAMRPGTVVLACHWLGESEDHVQRGQEVHEAISHPLLVGTLSSCYEGFRLDRWIRTT
ncbi:class I SAM-dependent methyltransferase [Terriglobus roseus]|uniref:Nodulation protein S (NodS) n=1 Tax=Terriglobus roseus TaxID=392734 RepID=A0A1G7HCI4_9BACT|nr:class I SAM-dependent methyltransferase [Terriglobus roseus]SDE98066.1 Nodulation protein S (NodS) [Terriglobus roseus]